MKLVSAVVAVNLRKSDIPVTKALLFEIAFIIREYQIYTDRQPNSFIQL